MEFTELDSFNDMSVKNGMTWFRKSVLNEVRAQFSWLLSDTITAEH